MKKICELFIRCTRAYSLPMSIMAWFIPFVYAALHKGNIFLGVLAFAGIISLHLAANMFDDFIDYQRHKKVQNQLQKGKCLYFTEKQISEKNFVIFMSVLFLFALLIGCYFIYLFKVPIILIMLITAILCLLYPYSSYYGSGEIIIGTIFSPLVFTGVYYVMLQMFSKELLTLSIPFGIMVVSLLYTHSFLDFNYDKYDSKKTICILCGNKEQAYKFMIFMLFMAYFATFAGLELRILSPAYSLTFLSLFPALSLCKTLQSYIDKEPQDEKEFLCVFNKAQKLTVVYTTLAVIATLINHL